MLTEQGIMRTEVVFNDDKMERYLLRKVWDESKPIVCLIMSNPSSANVVTIDMTVHYSICNLFKLGYGGVDILNMTSVISTKIDTKSDIKLNVINAEYILKSAEKADKVIIAWGKIGENNKKVRLVQLEVLEKLERFKDKLYVIASDTGEFGFHPLAPQIRFNWNLTPFVLPEYLQDQKEDEAQKPVEEKPEEPLKDEQKKPSTAETEKPNKDKSLRKNAQTA